MNDLFILDWNGTLDHLPPDDLRMHLKAIKDTGAIVVMNTAWFDLPKVINDYVDRVFRRVGLKDILKEFGEPEDWPERITIIDDRVHDNYDDAVLWLQRKHQDLGIEITLLESIEG